MAKRLSLVTPSGPAYRVLTDRLTWPADRAIVERLLAGENVPQDARGELCEAAQGEIRTDLVPESVPALLERGWIEPADQTSAATPDDQAAYRDDVNNEIAAFRPPRGR